MRIDMDSRVLKLKSWSQQQRQIHANKCCLNVGTAIDIVPKDDQRFQQMAEDAFVSTAQVKVEPNSEQVNLTADLDGVINAETKTAVEPLGPDLGLTKKGKPRKRASKKAKLDSEPLAVSIKEDPSAADGVLPQSEPSLAPTKTKKPRKKAAKIAKAEPPLVDSQPDSVLSSRTVVKAENFEEEGTTVIKSEPAILIPLEPLTEISAADVRGTNDTVNSSVKTETDGLQLPSAGTETGNEKLNGDATPDYGLTKAGKPRKRPLKPKSETKPVQMKSEAEPVKSKSKAKPDSQEEPFIAAVDQAEVGGLESAVEGTMPEIIPPNSESGAAGDESLDADLEAVKAAPKRRRKKVTRVDLVGDQPENQTGVKTEEGAVAKPKRRRGPDPNAFSKIFMLISKHRIYFLTILFSY